MLGGARDRRSRERGRPRPLSIVTEASMAWDPAQYLKFAGHRLRPAIDLLNRVDVADPGDVYDLGAGAGNVTRVLRGRRRARPTSSTRTPRCTGWTATTASSPRCSTRWPPPASSPCRCRGTAAP